MKDYSKTIIYKIVCNITGEVYYGHTTQTLDDRRKRHICEAVGTRNKHCVSRQILNRGDWKIMEVEKYPCANVKEARRREGWYILNNPHINIAVAGRTRKEHQKDNKERLNAISTAYYNKNKERQKASAMEYNKTHKVEKKAYNQSYYKFNKSWGADAWYVKGLNQIAIDLFD